MAWPPTTHQDVQDEVTAQRYAHADYFRSGNYTTGLFGAATASSTLSTNTAYARPFWINSPRSFDRIAVNVSTAAASGSGGVIALALFAPGPGIPGDLLLETAAVSSETTGAKEFTINQSLTAGVYWVGARSAVATCQVTAFASFMSPFTSGGATPPASTWGGFLQTATATAFPTTWTTASVIPTAHLISLRAV